MKKLKGWNKLTIQIIILSASMIVISFFTDTKLWLDTFNYKVTGSEIHSVIFGEQYHGCRINACKVNCCLKATLI